MRESQADSFVAVDAEQQLLGAVLTDPEAYHRVSDVLRPEHFHDPVHAEIWRIVATRVERGHVADALAVRAVMEHHEGLRQLGGAAYLIRLASCAIATFAARDYALMVVEAASKRMVGVAMQEAAEALRSGRDAQEVAAGMITALHRLPEVDGAESTLSLTRAMQAAVGEANEAYQGRAVYLKTGIRTLDDLLGGLGRGDLCLIGGVTSSGKTSVAIEIAARVAAEPEATVAFASLEMGAAEIATRMASRASRVPYSAVRDAQSMSEAEFRRWVEGARAEAERAIRIVPKHVRDVAAIYSTLRRIKAENDGKLSLVLVDYAQLIRAPGRDTVQQMREVSIGLKTVAQMLDVPLVALVQLSREIGKRENRRPVLSDIKETGQFENDADQVVFAHRESYWLERDGPEVKRDGSVTTDARADWEGALQEARNRMELIVAKNRHGRLGTARIGCHLPTNRFWDLDSADAADFA